MSLLVCRAFRDGVLWQRLKENVVLTKASVLINMSLNELVSMVALLGNQRMDI